MDQTHEAAALELIRRLHAYPADDAAPLVGDAVVPRGWVGDAAGENGLLVCWHGLDVLRGDQMVVPVGAVPAEVTDRLRLLYGHWSYSYSPADYPAVTIRSLVESLRSVWPDAEVVCVPDRMREIGHHDQMDLPDFVPEVSNVPTWLYVVQWRDERQLALSRDILDAEVLTGGS